MITWIKKYQKWLLILTVVVVSIFAYRPAMWRLREWRADQLLEEARDFAKQHRWHEVRRAALASNQLSPTIESARLFLEGHRNHPAILRAATALVLHPDATGDDHATALAAFLDARDLLNCSQIVRSLSQKEQAYSAVRYQIVRFHLEAGNLAEAVKVAEAESRERDPGRLDLLLAPPLIGSSSKEMRRDGYDRVAKLLDGTQRKVALDAMTILASQPDDLINEVLAKKAVDRFESDTGLSISQQLLLLVLRLKIAPDERATIVESAVGTYKDQHLKQLLPWLLRVGGAELVVELTETAEPTAHQFQHRANALRVLGRYDQLLDELENPAKGISPVVLYASRAAVSQLAARPSSEVDYLWQLAFSAAKQHHSENKYPSIESIARQVGAVDRQMEALACRIEHPVGIPPRSGQLGELFEWMAKRDTARMLAISRKLLRGEPGNPVLVNNYHYLTTLHGVPGDGTVTALEALVSKFPGTIPFRGSLAFAQVKTGNPQAAVETLDSTNLKIDSLPDAEKAVYTAALVALDRKAEAIRLQRSIDWSALDAGETEAITPLLAELRSPVPRPTSNQR